MPEGSKFVPEETFKSVRPYARARQEALHARQVITYFVNSLVEDPDASPDSIHFLANPADQARVIEIPAQVQGLRRKYLDALIAHQKARSDYEILANEVAPDAEPGDSGSGKSGLSRSGINDSVHSRVALLKQQQRTEELRGLDEQNRDLNGRASSKDAFLTLDNVNNELSHDHSSIHEENVLPQHSTDESEVSIRPLIINLEKAVIRAKRLAEKESLRVAELRSQYNSLAKTKEDNNIGRLQALEKARSELVSWIDQEISKSNPELHDTEDTIKHDHDNGSKLADVLEAINEKYAEYWISREACVAATQEPKVEVKNSTESAEEEVEEVAQQKPISKGTYEDIQGQLRFAAQLQRSVLAQRSFATTMLSKVQYSTLQKMQRLSDESSICKSLTAETEANVSATRITNEADRHHSRSGEEALELVKRWSATAELRGQQVHREVSGSTAAGLESLDTSDHIINDLFTKFGAEERREDGEIEAENAEDEKAGKRNRGRKAKKDERQSAWQQLDGKMGGIGDGV